MLLHGWPEFWLIWEPVMERLAARHTLIAPDLRGFGDSDKPDGPFGPADQAADMLALIDALGVERSGVVGYDVGGAVMQALARAAQERIAGPRMRSSRALGLLPVQDHLRPRDVSGHRSSPAP